MMTQEELLSHLCIHDERNPNYFLCDGMDKIEPRDNCYCDSCFYGKDELTLLILDLQTGV